MEAGTRSPATRPWGAGTRECVHVCVCMRVCACLCAYMGVHACVCACVCVCISVCMLVCTDLRRATEPGGCQQDGVLAQRTGRRADRQTDRHWAQGGSKPWRGVKGAAAIAATSSHRSVTGAGWSHLLRGGVIRVTQGLHIWTQGDPRKLLGPAASPPEETGQLGAARPPPLAASGRQRGRSTDHSPRRPRKWQIPVLRRLLVGLEMAALPSPGTLLESMEFITLTYFLSLSF